MFLVDMGYLILFFDEFCGFNNRGGEKVLLKIELVIKL